MENKLEKIGQNSFMDNFVKTDDILKDTAVKTKPFISKENAQNRPETIQRETVLGVSAFRELIGNSAAKRRCLLCPVCRNTARENGRSFLIYSLEFISFLLFIRVLL